MEHLIAHRGEPEQWPENSLSGFRAVLSAGATYIETDIQLTADLVPILCHDDSLARTTGHDLLVATSHFDAIRELPAGEPERFGDRFGSERIATLAELATLLVAWPDARAFIEIKSTSIQTFGSTTTIESVLEALAPAYTQCIPISFDYESLQQLNDQHELPIGWVLPEWSDSNRERAEALQPNYLFVDHRRVPSTPGPLWPGPWQWVAYTINDLDQVERLLRLGFDLVETNDIRRLQREFELQAAIPG